MNEKTGTVIIKLVDVVGDGLCSASEDGEKLHAAIKAALQDGKRVRLSFQGVVDLTSAFLNAGIGQLYGEFDEQTLKASLLPPIDASPDHLFTVKRAVDRAKSFFKNEERHKAAARRIFGADDDQHS